MKYRHESDLSKASTIPSTWYTDPIYQKREFEEIFLKGWNYVGRRADLIEPGSYFTSQIANENILVVLDEHRKVRAFSNVCRHRAGPLATSGKGCFTNKQIKCLYHNWTYSLNGDLKNTPEFQGVEDFNKDANGLFEFQVEVWGPLIFAAHRPQMSFEQYIGNIPNEIDYIDLSKLKFHATKDYHVEANWKVYVDNYLEGYHLPAVHPDLCKELNYSEYKVETSRWYSTQIAPSKEDAILYGSGDKPGAHYYWLFPNLMFNIYQGLLQTNLVIPVTPDQCIVRFDWFFMGDKYEEVNSRFENLLKFSDQLQDEDAFICGAIQKNLSSRFYLQGRFSVKRENGVHHFHGLLAEFLS